MESNTRPNNNNANYDMSFPPTHVFDAIIPRFRTNYSNAIDIPVEIHFYDGQTITTIFTDDAGNVTDCVVTEVK